MVTTLQPIQPHLGVGLLQLGSSRDEVRRQLGVPTYSDATKDFFFGNGVHAHYSLGGTLELIVIARGVFVATLDGVDLLNVDARRALDVVGRFGEVDSADPEYPLSCTFRQLDINLWRSCLPEDDPTGEGGRRFEAVGIGAKGYFSRHRAS